MSADAQGRFEAGNAAALHHGARSERQIRPRAATHRRRVLRQLRLRASEVDPIGRGYLDAYCRLRSKIDLLDLYLEEHGLLLPSGEPQPCLKLYASLHNSARLALGRLEDHLRQHGVEPSMVAQLQQVGRRPA